MKRLKQIFETDSLNFETDFLENENLFKKNWSTVFYLKALKLKTHNFYIKPPYQRPMLRQLEWWLQNGPITKNGVLPVTTFFFWKFCFSLRTSHKELIWCTNYPNVHIPTFCKRWSFIWHCFFPVSILNWWKTTYSLQSFFDLFRWLLGVRKFF